MNYVSQKVRFCMVKLQAPYMSRKVVIRFWLNKGFIVFMIMLSLVDHLCSNFWPAFANINAILSLMRGRI